MQHRRRSALVLALVASACGGRIEGEAGTAPAVEEGAASGEAFGEESRGGGEDVHAYAAAACGARGPFTPAFASSPVALQSSLAGRWVICPESLSLPDPLFGNAAYVGIHLAEISGAHPLLANGDDVIVQPAAYGWMMKSESSFELMRVRGKALVYEVVLGSDGRSMILSRSDLGSAPYALARLR